MKSQKNKTEKKIKLAVCLASPFVGGNERQIKRLTQEFVKRNYEITLVAWAGKPSERFFRSFSWARRVIVSQVLPHPVSFFLRQLEDDKPDLIIDSGAAGFSVEIAKHFHRPLFWRVISDPRHWPGNKKVFQDPTKQFLKMMGAFSNKIIFLSDSLKKPFIKLGLKNYERIYNGCDTDLFYPNFDQRRQFRKEFGLDDEEISIGVVANILPRKRHEAVIQALARLSKDGLPFKCFFIGAFEETLATRNQKKKLDKLIAKYGLKKSIVFTGSRNDRNRFMNGLDIHLFPFQGEGCSNALLEAMACEKAVIANNEGPFPEIIGHAREGLLVPMEDSKLFETQIASLIRDSKQRFSLGKRARLRILKKFSIEKQINTYDRLFKAASRDLLSVSNGSTAIARA